MKKTSVLALVATLGLAAPALAQTPADIKNFRTGTETPAVTEPVAITPKEEVKKPVKKSTTKKTTSSTKKATPVKKEETKTETKTEEKKTEEKK
ncbi:MAG: hypothetical protein EBV03_05580 [Proteobacteria bacterium]|nr:hypothetical protein [Pseudomonadota bacterium]